MNRITLLKAITTAERFLATAKVVPRVTINSITLLDLDAGKESAACRRASMDLTRILADLRQNR